MHNSLGRDDLLKIIHGQAYPPYAGYPAFRSDSERLRAFLSSWVADRLRRDTSIGSALKEAGRSRVMAFAEQDTLASRVFAFPMARVTLWGSADEALAEAAIREIVRRTRGQGIRHLSCRVDARETAWRRALSSLGFFGVDTLVSYVTARKGPPPKPVRWGLRTRLAERKDEPSIVRIAHGAFQWDRFHSDPHLDSGRSDALYAEWARLCCRKELADHVRVGIRSGRVAGFVAHRLFKDLHRLTGLRMYGQGLGASRPGCGDAYLAAVSEEICTVWGDMDWIEIETQAQNHSHIRLLTKMGFTPLRTSMTYHFWMGR